MKASSILDAVQGVTTKWAKQRKQEEKDAKARKNRANVMAPKSRFYTIKDAAFDIMKTAYLKASANGTLPAHARQIMYAARPYIMAKADRQIGSRFDGYFTQTLLPEYVEMTGENWNVVYDARGHFHEPHTGKEVALGTLQVREYLNAVRGFRPTKAEPHFRLNIDRFPTVGPVNRYGAVLFIEKEGFMPLFETVQLAERYDIAIMSTKGMSVTASRTLAETLCGNHGIPLLILHDFDKSGFSIAGTLQRDTRRHTFKRSFEVHDLGLRLEDIEGLDTEEVSVSYDSQPAVAKNLKKNGATQDEIEFLLNERVELNALASDALVAFIERKLEALGIGKVVPDAATLATAWSRATTTVLVNKKLDAVVDAAVRKASKLPVLADLEEQVRAKLKERPALSWDEAVAEIVAGNKSEDHP